MKTITVADLISSASIQQKKWDWDWYILFLTWFLKSNEKSNLQQKLQFLIHLLENNSAFRQVFAEKWSLFLEKVKFDSLWIYTFSGESDAFIQEFIWAFSQKFFSTPPQGHEISYLIDELLQSKLHIPELDQMPLTLFLPLKKYFTDDVLNKSSAELKASLIRSIYVLSNKNISDIFTPLFKMDSSSKFESGFFKMHDLVSMQKLTDVDQIKTLNEANLKSTDAVVSQFKETGVSLNLLFKIKKIRARLIRLQHLISLYESLKLDDLVAILTERKLFYSLKFQFLHYSSQLVEIVSLTSAEKGDHYVARTQAELSKLFAKACGGGFLTAFTVLIKTMTAYLALAPFAIGLLYSINYALSFVTIYLLGFTLATKQPAAIAAHLTQKWQSASKGEILNEIGLIFKSQISAILGNVGLVIPVVLLISFACESLFSQNFMTADKALKEIQSLSVLGFTPFYAFLTGYFLWFSTFVTGVADNFFKVHQFDQVMLNSPKVFSFLEKSTKRKWIQFIKNNFGALCGNIILGFILGLVPIVGDFLGLPIDVRHVTLASGSLAAAVYTLGLDVFYEPAIYLAMAGVMTVGLLNLSVSFVISMQVAESANSLTSEKTDKDSSKLLRLYILRKLQFWKS